MKKFLSVLLTVVMLFAMIPTMSFAPKTVDAAAEDIVTITVTDDNGTPLKNATVTVTRVYTTWGAGNLRSQTVTVKTNGDGTFTYDTSAYYYGNTQHYLVSAECSGYPSKTEQVAPTTRAMVLALGAETIVPQWVVFDVYYIATGRTPISFYAHGEPEEYGPSANDVPLVQINVDINKLKSAKYADAVVYEENNGNTYHFLPIGDISENAKEDEKRARMVPFWEAVVDCMDQASIDAFKATGFFNTFLPYCLKNQGSAYNPDNHCDGILTVDPPVYVVELNDKGTYIGGFANDNDTVLGKHTTMKDIFTFYNTHFDQDLQWTLTGEDTYQGTYVEDHVEYTLQIVQTNGANANVTVGQSDVRYATVIEGKYYLAAFDAELKNTRRTAFTVTYTDGTDDVVFLDQINSVDRNHRAPAFTGNTERNNYTFLGWVLQGGDGTILSDADIAATYTAVTSDLTFVAAYELKPQTFAGTVEVILDGTFDAASMTANGQRIDITTAEAADTTLWLSADGQNFTALERTATGVYTAKLENGIYRIYYKNGDTYTLASNQQLDINDAARTRYLFFNTVTYVLNGGKDGPTPAKTYYDTQTSVNVSDVVPTRDGYRFIGWEDQDGNRYDSGTILTAAIAKSYVLVAQWEKILYASVNVNVTIDRDAANGGTNDNTRQPLELDLTYRPVGTTEDYVEVVGKDFVTTDWYTDGTQNGNITTVSYTALWDMLDINWAYSANAFMKEYSLVDRSVSVTADAEGNLTYTVDIRLKFTPTYCDLVFNVIEKIESDALTPVATDIKVYPFYDPQGLEGAYGKQWFPISEHLHSTHDVLFDGTNANGDRIGSDSYRVWAWEDAENGIPYYYRVSALGFTLKDGTEITAVTTDFENYTSLASADGRYPAGAFTATVNVTGGGTPNGATLDGAYFDENGTQYGDILITVYAHPYTVTFDPAGGTLNGTTAPTTVPDLFVVPDTGAYVPTRNDAYVFDGWYLADQNGNITNTTVTVGAPLTANITLIAKWKAPKTVEGLVTVGATYEQENQNGTISIHEIPDASLPTYAHILLQRIDANGYFETVRSEHIHFDYTNQDYYLKGDNDNEDRKVGFATYRFENIPDDGTVYRVQLLLPNFVSLFQNEPNSLTNALNYPSYNLADYTVVWGATAPTVGTANVHNHFSPDEFTLLYNVDATAIGEGFRPDSAEILITCDDKLGNPAPETWPVISQMVFGKLFIGNPVVLEENGLGQGSDRVWISRPDGTTYYQYGIRLHSTTADDVTTPYDEKLLPYTVTYQAPAHYHYGSQSQLLIATLAPKTYAIKYELNRGTMEGEAPTTHTWSYDTALALPTPVRNGFVFNGWYLDAAFTTPVGDVIDAAVHADTTLYAKWEQVMDIVDLTVIINHDQEDGGSGLAANYNKTLFTQLTYDLRENAGDPNRIFADAPGYARAYVNGMWHTRGDSVRQDIFQVPQFYANLSANYDYSVNVQLEGYYVTDKKTEKIEQKDGSTKHQVTVTLQYKPDLLMLNFDVIVADNVPTDMVPLSAEVKVTSWTDDPSEAIGWEWFRITQHQSTTVTVPINPATRKGTGTYPVWMWFNKENNDAYHYRIEVLQLNFENDVTIHMTETTADVNYAGGGYETFVTTTGGAVPQYGDATTTLEGVYGKETADGYVQQGTVAAIINTGRITFHANNTAYEGNDAFKNFYYNAVPAFDENGKVVNANGTISRFYDIPTFDYLTHNQYIFKGWYLDKDSENRPFNWDTVFSGESVDIYAHWINVGTVAKEATDEKNVAGDIYSEYDFAGVQIRDAQLDDMDHYGNPDSGLRFVASLSERVWSEITALGTATYGFVMGKAATADGFATTDDYTLLYKDTNVNGVDTTASHPYVQNVVCSSVPGRFIPDHFNGDTYRLYTAVVTYGGMTGEKLETAYATDFVTRAFIRYTDANGMTRVYHNNYTGASATYGACRTSFADVRDIMG